jgi:acetyl-CoA synthetase
VPYANVLKRNGAKKGDRICIYMPMIPELTIAVLGLRAHRRDPFRGVRGLQRQSIADRVNDAQFVVLTSDGMNRGHKQIPVKRVVDEALEECPSVKR